MSNALSPAEQNAINMADATFAALTAPRQQRFYVNCQAHNQPATHDGKCQHCALDDAEQIIINAQREYGLRKDTPISAVLCRVQMWVNVARYSQQNQRQFEHIEARVNASKMAVLWSLLLD